MGVEYNDKMDVEYIDNKPFNKQITYIDKITVPKYGHLVRQVPIDKMLGTTAIDGVKKADPKQLTYTSGAGKRRRSTKKTKKSKKSRSRRHRKTRK
jgi:hypothetical protein